MRALQFLLMCSEVEIESNIHSILLISQADKDKNALSAAFSLACLEIRPRNKGAINSTRNSIYLLKIFYFLLYWCQYILFVSELI